MKKLFAFLCTAGLVAGLAGVAGATIYPPGIPPCVPTDTMTIVNIQDPTQACHPASTDTVYGVRGVITAIDSIATAYGFFMQLPGSNPYSGIDVFTGSTNYQSNVPGTPTGGNLFYGDQIAVDGRALEFNGLTEMTDFDNIQSTNDIVIRKTSASRVAIPPFHIGTPLELDWVPGWTSANGAANQEPWEGMLVRVRGPLVCGRTAGTGIGSRSMLIAGVGGTANLDTLCADGFSLTNVAALSVGAPIDSVQGVLTQVTISSVPSYRILMRGVYDLFAAAPPNVIDAYAISEANVADSKVAGNKTQATQTVIRVVFDRPVQAASATNTGNYSLQSFGSIDNCTLEADSKAVDVAIGATLPAAAHGASETITVQNVVSSSGLPMSGSQPRTFINGVLSIAEIQAPDPAGLSGSPCGDHSKYSGAAGVTGTRLSYTGVVIGSPGNLYYLEDQNGAQRSGLPVFGSPVFLSDAHKYLVAGAVQEFDGISTTITNGFTEGVNTQYVKDLGAVTPPAPAVQTIHVLSDTTCDANQNLTTAEDYEGMLVSVDYARVVENRNAGDSFLITGNPPSWAPDTMLVTNLNNSYSYAAESTMTLKITGLLNFRNGNLPWRISPRSDADIVRKGFNVGNVGVDGPRGTRELSLAVSPNPSRTARINFSVPVAGKVDLGVFDISGRRLTTILRGEVPAGDYTRVWSGTDAEGNPMRSGVYFYRLRVGDKLISTTSIKLN